VILTFTRPRGGDGTDWITNEGGTSLFDRDGDFPPKKWATFNILKGKVVPESIWLKDDGWRERFKATHYLILLTANPMRSGAHRGNLENLARHAVVRSIELASSN
jgi:Tse2 ADP-ribosyltransferase toxins